MAEHEITPLTGQGFWDRLKEATKAVETWPDWMKGSRENKREAKVADQKTHAYLTAEEIAEIKKVALINANWGYGDDKITLRLLSDLKALQNENRLWYDRANQTNDKLLAAESELKAIRAERDEANSAADALVIQRHQEIAAGTMARYSAIWTMADVALKTQFPQPKVTPSA